MNNRMTMISLTVLSLISSSAFALDAQKSATRIDFNKMIDENNTGDLHNDVRAKMADKQVGQDVKVNSDKSKVLDFVDVEIGLGEDRPVVDRRFNSDADPVVAPEFNQKAEPSFN